MMKLLTAAVAVITLAVSSSINPGVRIQLSSHGLDYIKGIGINELNKHIKEVKIPNISGKESPLEYDLSNFVISAFTASSSNTHITVGRPNTATLTASGVSAAVTANWHIKVGSGWFSVSASGSVDAAASGVSFGQGIAVSQYGGKPHLTAGRCSASIGHLSLTFHGDVVASIANLFSSIIENYVKGKLADVICAQLPGLINSDLNAELNKIPTSIDLGSGFNIDYSLTSNPSVDGTGDVVIPFLGEIYYTGHHNDPNVPKALPMGDLLQDSSKMVCIEISPTGLIGSLAYAAKTEGLLNFQLTKALLQTFGVEKYMACNCSSMCIGAFIPQIKTKCSHGGSVEVDMTATDTPMAQSNSSGIFLSFGWDLDFKGVDGSSKVELFTAHVAFSAVIPSPLTFDGWKIKGQVHATGAALTIKSSNVGQLDQAGLQQIFQLAIVTVIEGKLNKVAEAGIPLPDLPDVTVLQPSVTVGNQQITVCANLQYTGPTY